MVYGTMGKIETVSLTTNQTDITFSNIPATYDDLLLKVSARNSNTNNEFTLRFNGTSTGYSSRVLYGTGSAASSYTGGSTAMDGSPSEPSNYTTSTFANTEIYIPNYRSSNNKSVSIDGVQENNATAALAQLGAGLWSNSAAITSISLVASFAANTTATLYGITRVPAGVKATGGVIYDDSSYWYHVFTSSGTFTPSQSISADVLVIAGGGSGGSALGGGGGAGGLLAHTNQALTATNYTITIGAGGAAYRGSAPVNSQGSSGSNSQFASLTASVGGGRGGTYNTYAAGASGGSGGGGGAISGSAGTLTSGQGNNGAAGGSTSQGQGGGGGASGAGGAFSGKIGGAGGAGSSSYSSWGLATNTGENSSGTFYFAGGGGGCMDQTGTSAGGLGGGGVGVYTTGSAGDGIAFTGGGGGGHRESATPTTNGGGNGGSGIVIVRYAK